MKHHEPVAGHLVAAVLRAEKPASAELVLVEDAEDRLAGAVPIARLIAAQDVPLAQLAQRDFPRVTPGIDQEHAASLALHHAVDALPVVDKDGRALGSGLLATVVQDILSLLVYLGVVSAFGL